MPKKDRPDPLGGFDATTQRQNRGEATDRRRVDAPTPVSRHTVQLNVQVPAELRTPFRMKAMQEGRTMSEIVSEWIEEYLRE